MSYPLTLVMPAGTPVNTACPFGGQKVYRTVFHYRRTALRAREYGTVVALKPCHSQAIAADARTVFKQQSTNMARQHLAHYLGKSFRGCLTSLFFTSLTLA
jgi:hypothetical protein